MVRARLFSFDLYQVEERKFSVKFEGIFLMFIDEKNPQLYVDSKMNYAIGKLYFI